MMFIKQNTGLLRSVRSWGALGLVLAFAAVASVGETTAVPEANTVKLQFDSTIVPKKACPLVAWVGYVSGPKSYPLKDYTVEFWKLGNPSTLMASVKSDQNGQARFNAPLGTIIEARVKVSYGVLLGGPLQCSNNNNDTQ